MAAKKKQAPSEARRRWNPSSIPPMAVAAAALLVGLALLYPGPMLQSQEFRASDTANADHFAAVADASLAEGHYPLWNPYLFCGMPTFGSVAYVKYVYPPLVVFNFLHQKLAFPPLTWMLTHLLFGGLGMAWLLQRWKLPTAALVLGALVWICLPKIVAWGVHGHGTKLGAIMYLPWIIGSAMNVLGGRGARAVAWTALLLGLQLLRGHVQITYYTLLLLGWLVLFNAVRQITPGEAVATAQRLRRTALLAGALVVALLIGAALLLPVYSYQGLSVRGGGDEAGGAGIDYATGWSLAPSELPTLVLPAAAGFGKATYLGAMPFNDYPNYFGLLLIALSAAAWGSGRRKLLVALAVASALALMVSFGRHWAGFYGVLYDHLPFFNRFRIPSMVLILPAFALTVLAALGAARLREAGTRMLRISAVVVGGIGVLLLMSGATGLAESGYVASLRSLATAAGKNAPDVLVDAAWRLQRTDLVRIGLVLMTAGAAVMLASRREVFRRHGLIWVLAVLLVIDLSAVDRRIIHPEDALLEVAQDASGRGRLVSASRLLGAERPRDVGVDPAHLELAATLGHERIWPLGQLAMTNDLMSAGVRSLGGYHPAKPAACEKIRKRLADPYRPAARLAAWLGAARVVLRGRLPEENFEPLKMLGADLDPAGRAFGSLAAYTNRSALPRARLVDTFVEAGSTPECSGGDALLDAIQTGAWDPRGRVVLEEAPRPEPTAATTLPPVEFLSDGLDEVVVRSSAETPTILVLADLNLPGWRVEVDGEAADLLRADFFLRGVALEAGPHEVRFVYSDPAVRRGLVACVVGLLIVAALMLAPLFQSRMRPAGALAASGPREDAS